MYDCKAGLGLNGELCRAIRSNGGSAVGKACSCRNDVICAGGQIDGHALITRVSDSYGLFFGSLRISISGGAEVQSCPRSPLRFAVGQ